MKTIEIYYYNNYTGNKEDSHELLRKAMMQRSEEVDELIADMKIGEMGKPSIPGYDDFSISHSESSWAVAFNDKYCGLDIQFSKKADCIKIAEKWFHEEEVEAVKGAATSEESRKEIGTGGDDEAIGDCADAFFRIWARREALVKAVGTSIVNSHLPSTLGDEVEFEGKKWIIKDVELPGIEHAAVCAETVEDIEIIELK